MHLATFCTAVALSVVLLYNADPAAAGNGKLPQYFVLYEKREIFDPLTKYGRGPWRYMTYGHGVTYGSKEKGKAFERGYGYIRALGLEMCDVDPSMCAPRVPGPFEYRGRKEPYFGYRPKSHDFNVPELERLERQV